MPRDAGAAGRAGGRSSSDSVGRPRDPGVEPRVRRATLRLLRERGYAALRIDDVATASGVAKTTIYRRWPSLAHVVLDAMSAAVGPREVPETGDLDADLEALLRVVYESLVTGAAADTFPWIGIDLMRQPELAQEYRRRFVDPLRERAVLLIERGAREGRWGPGASARVLVDAVTGGIVLRRLLGEDLPSLDEVLDLARAALRR